MSVNNLLDNCQTQAKAALLACASAVDAVEPVEDMRQIGWRNTRTRIANDYLDVGWC